MRDVGTRTFGTTTRGAVWIGCAVLALSLAVTAFAWRESIREVERRRASEFETLTVEIRLRLEERIAAYTQILRGGAALFASARPISRNGWHRYVSGLDLANGFPAISAVAFARMATYPDLERLTAEARADGLPDFAVRPPGRRDHYVINVYSEPFTGANIRALGYDMWQDSDRRATMERAAALGRPMITERVTLRVDEESTPVPAFIMYMPVRLDPDGEIYGFVLSPFRMPTLMHDVMGRHAGLLMLSIYDGPEAVPERLFHREGPDAPAGLVLRRSMEVGGRTWTLEFASLSGLDSRVESDRPTVVALVGLALGLLLSAVAWSLASTRDQAEAIAAERTRELKQTADEIGRINTQLRRQTTQLERSNAELEQFAYVASHDLQEPLRMISSYAQLIARRYTARLDADADEFIGYMVEGATRMQAMIHDLLEYSRIGRKEDVPCEVEAGAMVDAARLQLKVLLDEVGGRIEWGPLPTLTVRPTQFLALLQNLIGNALKYRDPARPPVVSVTAERRDDEWLFAVSDNGIGFGAEYADKIFLIFQRLHTRDRYDGSGIGLAICKKIVENHGGRIWVESTPGQGSTFFFSLPAAPSPP